MPKEDGIEQLQKEDLLITVKRIKKERKRLYLMPENKNYKPIEIKEENELIIWGIVQYVIKKI